MEGASLEGQLKAAEIAELYSRVTKQNAEEAKIREETIWLRISSQVDLMRKLGAEPRVMELPDGTLGIVIGDKVFSRLRGTALGTGDQEQE
jgi:hypothetical protein